MPPHNKFIRSLRIHTSGLNVAIYETIVVAGKLFSNFNWHQIAPFVLVPFNLFWLEHDQYKLFRWHSMESAEKDFESVHYESLLCSQHIHIAFEGESNSGEHIWWYNEM